MRLGLLTLMVVIRALVVPDGLNLFLDGMPSHEWLGYFRGHLDGSICSSYN